MLRKCLKIVCALLAVLAVEQGVFPLAKAQEVTPGPYYQPPPPMDAETGNIIYTTVNPPPPGANFNWGGFINFNTGGGGLSGGNVPAYNSQTGTFIFGYQQGTVTYNFFGSSDWPTSGVDVNGFKYSWEYFNQDFSRGNISANIKIFDTDNNILENYNFAMPQTTNGWTLMSGQIDFDTPYDRSELGRLQLSFTGKDDRFWAGYYGPQVRGMDVSVMYTDPPPTLPTFLYWNNVVNEGGTFTLTEETTVRYGAEGTYIYATLQAGTYECTSSAWGMDPLGGVYKGCEVGTNEAPVVAVDCAVNPTDSSCVIDSILDDFIPDPTEEQPMLADETGSDDGSSDGTEVVEEEEDTPVGDTVKETETLEELLQDDAADDTLVADDTGSGDTLERTAEPVATVAAIADEGKANELADSISKNVLEGALAIAADATAAGGSTTTASDTQSSTRTAATATANTASTTQETAVSETKVEENKVDSTESAVAALELLDTGRQMGRDALATTMAATEQSAQESLAQAESIAAASSETQNTNNTAVETVSTASVEDTSSTAVVASNEQAVDEIRETRTEVESTAVETTTEIEIVMASTSETIAETTDAGSTAMETVAEVNEVESTMETVVADTPAIEQADSFADIMNLEIKAVGEIKDEDVEFVQQVLAASEQQRQQEETNNTGFSEEEKITIQSDPALANAFNVVPNVSNLEAAGVLNQKQEEKSDAEKRADEVVAANAKEQEEINKNYMDEDQSGIVAAMGADTDVGDYRSAMLQDNNTWYRPEDIYKNVVYKDNVRGAYFLEKGNTDTYKKMVEEQYR